MNKPRIATSLALALTTLQVPPQALAKDLVDVIPGLYGGDGITLAPPEGPFPSHEAHFLLASTESVLALNKLIAGEIRPFPVSPSAGGVTYQFDPAQGTYVQTSQTLGPLVSERPETLGQGKFSLGFAVTYFEYDEFEGHDLGKLRATALHDFDIIAPPDSPDSFENDTLDIQFDIDLRFTALALAGTYGVTDRLDVSLIVPIIKASMDVDAEAMVEVSEENPFPGAHTFEGGDESPFDSDSESATGIGDVVLGAKYFLLDEQRYNVAGAARVKFETGDEDNFLGTGSTNLQPFVIASANITDKIIANTNLGFDLDLDDSDRDEFLYKVGVYGGSPQLTGAVDIVGRHRLNESGTGDDIVDAAFGVKWSPTKNLIFSANVQVPLNDDGLRSDVISTIGLEYRN
ncbi:transporter [Marinobacterium aestuariivivens]|uniref:Transporter n=1 Tax=Marinobacterium aestuariivivens TaxID=1698799 RepID=A0ABW1ZY66_9GAMM